MIILGESDDKATGGELHAATSRHLDRGADEVCCKGAISSDNCDVDLKNKNPNTSPKTLSEYYLQEQNFPGKTIVGEVGGKIGEITEILNSYIY